MGVTFVKRSTLPAPVKGKESTLSVMITNNGQIQLSKKSTDFIESAKHVGMAFDGLKVYIFKPTSPQVSKLDEKDLVTLSYPKKEKSGKNASFSAASILRAMKDFGASVVYDFKASGNQNFPCKPGKNNDFLVFELPAEGKLTPKVGTPRKKKAKPAPATAANPGEVAGTPVGTVPTPAPVVEEEEIDLDAA